MNGELTDDDLIRQFESCTLEEFHHEDHVRLAWALLRQTPLLEGLRRFVTGLERFAAARGAAAIYHETITWTYLLLIHDRMQRSDISTFEEFREENRDLFRRKPSIVETMYEEDTLGSDLARRVYLLPDRGK